MTIPLPTTTKGTNDKWTYNPSEVEKKKDNNQTPNPAQQTESLSGSHRKKIKAKKETPEEEVNTDKTTPTKEKVKEIEKPFDKKGKLSKSSNEPEHPSGKNVIKRKEDKAETKLTVTSLDASDEGGSDSFEYSDAVKESKAKEKEEVEMSIKDLKALLKKPESLQRHQKPAVVYLVVHYGYEFFLPYCKKRQVEENIEFLKNYLEWKKLNLDRKDVDLDLVGLATILKTYIIEEKIASLKELENSLVINIPNYIRQPILTSFEQKDFNKLKKSLEVASEHIADLLWMNCLLSVFMDDKKIYGKFVKLLKE